MLWLDLIDGRTFDLLVDSKDLALMRRKSPLSRALSPLEFVAAYWVRGVLPDTTQLCLILARDSADMPLLWSLQLVPTRATDTKFYELRASIIGPCQDLRDTCRHYGLDPQHLLTALHHTYQANPPSTG